MNKSWFQEVLIYLKKEEMPDGSFIPLYDFLINELKITPDSIPAASKIKLILDNLQEKKFISFTVSKTSLHPERILPVSEFGNPNFGDSKYSALIYWYINARIEIDGIKYISDILRTDMEDKLREQIIEVNKSAISVNSSTKRSNAISVILGKKLDKYNHLMLASTIAIAIATIINVIISVVSFNDSKKNSEITQKSLQDQKELIVLYYTRVIQSIKDDTLLIHKGAKVDTFFLKK